MKATIHFIGVVTFIVVSYFLPLGLRRDPGAYTSTVVHVQAHMVQHADGNSAPESVNECSVSALQYIIRLSPQIFHFLGKRVIKVTKIH